MWEIWQRYMIICVNLYTDKFTAIAVAEVSVTFRNQTIKLEKGWPRVFVLFFTYLSIFSQFISSYELKQSLLNARFHSRYIVGFISPNFIC